MSAQQVIFHQWIQEPLEAGWISQRQAWELMLEAAVNPQTPWPQELASSLQTVRLFHIHPVSPIHQ